MMGSIPIRMTILTHGCVGQLADPADCKSALYGACRFESYHIHLRVGEVVTRRAHNPKIRGANPLPATIHGLMEPSAVY